MKNYILIGIGLFAIFTILFVINAEAGITYTAGTNLITLDDDAGDGNSWANAFDMEDVLSNCGAVVTKQGTNAYDISARMHFLDGVYFVSENEFVELKPNPVNPAYTIDADAGSHIRIGDYDSTDDYCFNGAKWNIYMNACTGTRLDRFDGELLIYGSNIWSDSASYVDSFNFWGTTRIFDCEMEGNAYISGTDINFQRVTWMGKHTSYDMLYASGYDFDWSGIKAMNCQKGIFLSGTVTSDIDLYDVTIVDCTYDVYVSGNKLMRIINSDFDNTKTVCPANRIGIQECYTFNVLVTNKTNYPLSGALVVLKDNENTTVFSVNTDSNGRLPNNQIVKMWENRYNVKKDFNNHTLKITLNGYSDYETDIKVDHLIDGDQIVLDALVYSYDDIVDLLMAGFEIEPLTFFIILALSLLAMGIYKKDMIIGYLCCFVSTFMFLILTATTIGESSLMSTAYILLAFLSAGIGVYKVFLQRTEIEQDERSKDA